MAAQELNQLPADAGAEVAFAGRSNVGKSSVINALCGRRALARTSRTPGRTQQLVIFELAEGRRLVDLPGFGYAAVARSMREHWAAIIPRYLERRTSLAGTVLITDARHPLKAAETLLLEWCAATRLPAIVLLNKCDKLSRQQGLQALRAATATVQGIDPGMSCRLVSAEKGTGIADLRRTVGCWLTERVEEG